MYFNSNKQEENKFKIKLVGIFALLIILSMLIMVFDKRKKLVYVRSIIQTNYTIPIKNIAKTPQGIYERISSFFINQSELLKKNEYQEKKIAWLNASVVKQVSIKAENIRLKALLGVSEAGEEHINSVVIAEIIDSYINVNKHQIEINKGTDDSAFLGQVAIGEKGVVGQITKIYSKTSIISLLSDARQRIPVYIERNRARAMLVGHGDLNELELSFIDNYTDINIGDELITSGVGGKYPKGYQVGKVVSIGKNVTGSSDIIKVKPYARLNRLLELLLIVPSNKAEQ